MQNSENKEYSTQKILKGGGDGGIKKGLQWAGRRIRWKISERDEVGNHESFPPVVGYCIRVSVLRELDRIRMPSTDTERWGRVRRKRGGLSALQTLQLSIISLQPLFSFMILFLDLCQQLPDLLQRFLLLQTDVCILISLFTVVLHFFARVFHFDDAESCGRTFEEVAQRGKFGEISLGTEDGFG